MRTVLLVMLLAGCSSMPPRLESDAGSAPAADAGFVADAQRISDDAGAVAPDATAPSPDALSIATWNLETFPLRAGTIEAVAAQVEAHDLDLIGVQEIMDRAAFEQLDQALPDHEAVISFSGFQRVGFLYRSDRLEVSEIDLLFRDDSYAFPRPALTAEITVRDGDGAALFDFAFMVVHLKAQIDETSRLRRVAAIEALSGWMAERAQTEPEIVVVGDFNDSLLDPPESNVFGPLLGAPDQYTFLTTPNERAGEFTYIAFTKMIDHVLVSASAERWYGGGSTEVLRLDREVDGYEELVSDHLPVVSRFALPSP